MDNLKDSISARGSFEPLTIINDIIKRGSIIFLLALAASLLIYVAVDITYVPEYTVRGTYVVSKKASSYAYANLSAAIDTAENLGKILESSVLKKKVCEDLGISHFSGTTSTEIIPETNMMTISLTSESPEMAFRLYESVMRNYSQVSDYLIGDVVLEVLEEPTVPTGPSNYIDSQTPKKDAFIYTAGALILLFGILSYLRDTVRTETDAKKKIDGFYIGAIHHENRFKTVRAMVFRPKGSVLVTNATSSFRYVENMRKLTLKLRNRLDEKKAQILLVTSVNENEGKSTVAANLALCLAQEASKVALVDCDFRKPAQFKIFDKEKKTIPELGRYLGGELEIEDIICKDEKTGLYYVMGTENYENSTEMISNGRIEELFDWLKANMNYIVVDTSPMALVPDAEELSEYADASLMVVRQHVSEALEINDNIEVLEGSRSHFAGFVLNNLYDGIGSLVQNDYGYGYSYGYGYGYGKYGHYNKSDRK